MYKREKKSLLKKNTIKHLITLIINSARQIYYKFLSFTYLFFSLFPIKKNKIVITNYYGKGYGDNGKYIVEEIIKRGLNYDIVWIVNDYKQIEFPQIIRTVKKLTLRSIYEEATAAVWIDNSRKFSFVRKRSNQFYIQTWHGGIALKKIENDAIDKLTSSYINNAVNDSKMANLLISNSTFCTNLYKKSFWYNGLILECGSPRNDIIVNNTEKSKIKVREKINLSTNAKIVLYAPTFRNNSSIDSYDMNTVNIIKTLENKYNEQWVVLVRLHPNVSHISKKMQYSEKVKDVSLYDDMQELMLISDILVTDFSSIMFEFMLTKKPVLLYINDFMNYIKERNIYFDLNSLPFPIAKSNTELISNIISFNSSIYENVIAKFAIDVGLNETGKASEIIVEEIIKQTSKL